MVVDFHPNYGLESLSLVMNPSPRHPRSFYSLSNYFQGLAGDFRAFPRNFGPCPRIFGPCPRISLRVINIFIHMYIYIYICMKKRFRDEGLGF